MGLLLFPPRRSVSPDFLLHGQFLVAKATSSKKLGVWAAIKHDSRPKNLSASASLSTYARCTCLIQHQEVFSHNAQITYMYLLATLFLTSCNWCNLYNELKDLKPKNFGPKLKDHLLRGKLRLRAGTAMGDHEDDDSENCDLWRVKNG